MFSVSGLEPFTVLGYSVCPISRISSLKQVVTHVMSLRQRDIIAGLGVGNDRYLRRNVLPAILCLSGATPRDCYAADTPPYIPLH